MQQFVPSAPTDIGFHGRSFLHSQIALKVMAKFIKRVRYQVLHVRNELINFLPWYIVEYITRFVVLITQAPTLVTKLLDI